MQIQGAQQTRRYFAPVHKETESAYGVQFPDFPNVFSAADEQKDSVPKAVEAPRFAAEDGALPEPSGHNAVVAREDVRAALAEGAYLVSVPLIGNDSAVVRANVTFDRGLLEAIDEAARAHGLTRAAFPATAARHEIEA